MKNMKIKSKFLFTFAVIIGFFLINVICLVASLHRVAASFQTFYDGPYNSTQVAARMCEELQSVQKDLALAMLLEPQDEIQAHTDQCTAAFASLQEDLVALQDLFQGDPALLRDLESGLGEAKGVLDEALALNLRSAWERASELTETQLTPMLEDAQTLLGSISAAASENADSFFSNAMHTKMLASVVCILLSAFNLGLAVVMGLRLTRGFVGPIYELKAANRQILEGDLEAHVAYESRDELGDLAGATREMVHTLRSYIRELSAGLSEISQRNFSVTIEQEFVGEFAQLKESLLTITQSVSEAMRQIEAAAGEVSNGSEQVSAGSQALSQGTTQQASAIEELAATINEISQQTNSNAKNSVEASAKAAGVGRQMAQSNQRMQDMMTAMEEISSGSSEIGKIIKTIEDIAFQTNILALNAAVEAARAGAAGKGFAVVADEVRNLAGKSSEASKSTAALIENSISAVDRGVNLAKATAETLVDAVEGAADVAKTIQKISSASEEQARSVSQIMQGIDQISAVVQTNSATAEQSAAASEELSEQAHALNSLAHQFKLAGEDSPAGE